MKKPKRGEVYYINLPAPKENDVVTCGSRPCVVVSNNIGNAHSGIVMVVPIKGNSKSRLPTHAQIELQFPCVAMCENIMTVGQTDLDRLVGICTHDEMLSIDRCIEVALGIGRR